MFIAFCFGAYQSLLNIYFINLLIMQFRVSVLFAESVFSLSGLLSEFVLSIGWDVCIVDINQLIWYGRRYKLNIVAASASPLIMRLASLEKINPN